MSRAATSGALLSDAPPSSTAASSASGGASSGSGGAPDYARKKCYSYPVLQNDLKVRIESLCDDSANRVLCDATFAIGAEATQFNVVSALFAIHSTELNSMLSANEDASVMEIEDVTPSCFTFLREYFYCLNPIITVQNVSDILYASNKLKISSLSLAAKQFILAVDGVDDLLLLLSLLHALGLLEMCNQVITKNKLFEDAAKVFHSANLNLLPTELMIRLLKQATFQEGSLLLDEEELFEKCVVWAKHKSKVLLAQAAAGGKKKKRVKKRKKAKRKKAKQEAVQLAVEEGDEDGAGAGSGGLDDEDGDSEEAKEVEVAPPEQSDESEEESSSEEEEEEAEEIETDWKELIQPLLLYVRFPIMAGEYFAAQVVELSLISADDCTFIMQYLLTSKESKALKYSTKRRGIPRKN